MLEFTQNKGKHICGISVCNPVDIEETYLNNAVDYAIRKRYNHIQFIGPIHDAVKGNIDGITNYRKYEQFNKEKDLTYLQYANRVINAACEKASAAGLKTYAWHHELELPFGFEQAFPQILNSCGDVEVTSYEVKDFLIHKIRDFFKQYPKMDGIILTLHETRVPLLKLKEQKLDGTERVKYVIKILLDACTECGKELIVRPFASVEEDYATMMRAYEEVSTDMVVMDKWTQFDWSLCLPDNAFYSKIKRNPLLVETDIFGEYFGKGRFPLMLKGHILHKYAYCEKFSPVGYCSRIDRSGEIPFGEVNEVNLDIMHACMTGEDVDYAIDNFFAEKYGEAGGEIRALMEPTEDILRKIIYLKEYYFSELSIFPSLNHCKNHFYFEMMKEHYEIASDEWFVPKDWERGSIQSVLEEKEEAEVLTKELYHRLLKLEGRIEATEFEKLRIKFQNLMLCAAIWKSVATVFINYVKYFETEDSAYKSKLEQELHTLLEYDEVGKQTLGCRFYCSVGDNATANGSRSFDYIPSFVREVRESFAAEEHAITQMKKEIGLCDYIICGGGMEGHRLQKEVNFSDTMVREGALCRIAGTMRGADWCSVNEHGWFSYEINVNPYAVNVIQVWMEGMHEKLGVRVVIGEDTHTISEKTTGRKMYCFHYKEETGNKSVRIRFEKTLEHAPCVFSITVRGNEKEEE